MKQRLQNVFVALFLVTAICSGTIAKAQSRKALTYIGSFGTGVYRDADPRSSEIPAYDPINRHIFVVNPYGTNGTDPSVDVLQLPVSAGAPTFVTKIAITNGAPNSVAVNGNLLAIAIDATAKTDSGRVDFYTLASGQNPVFAASFKTGALPDMVTFSNDGAYVLTANEGEPNNYNAGNIDPEGSVTIVLLNRSNVPASTVSHVRFTDFNFGGSRRAELTDTTNTGVRIFGPRATVAQDLEPEYISVQGDTAFVSCQENNAMVLVRISTAQVISIRPLGVKNHNVQGAGLDASDRDSANVAAIRILPQPLFGIYQPDGIASYRVAGETYVITANEGDARDYTGFSEESRLGSSRTLDTTVFGGAANAATVRSNAVLGRLTITTALADTNSSGQFRAIYSFGARSFSIFRVNANSLTRVYDSGDQFEQITASLYPRNFNASNTSNALDNRSDDKGPEPESVTLATIGDSVYAFIGLERMGGVMVYNVTNPNAPGFVQYLNNRNLSVSPGGAAVVSGPTTNRAVLTSFSGDLGPEGILFVPQAQSPYGYPLVIVANEISGTTTVYAFKDETSLSSPREVAVPREFALSQNYPNPFNPSTRIAYQLPSAASVQLEVFDVLGRKVATLVNSRQDAGRYEVPFNASQLSTGVYFYRIQAGSFNQTMKMLLVK
ncbi:MAG: choice-of-anchor I family protein [Chloroherpetonaceae bacterium]|nr:choice-of-anchor I family protein [Chloroherpetonaceae bacterium]